MLRFLCPEAACAEIPPAESFRALRFLRPDAPRAQIRLGRERMQTPDWAAPQAQIGLPGRCAVSDLCICTIRRLGCALQAQIRPSGRSDWSTLTFRRLRFVHLDALHAQIRPP